AATGLTGQPVDTLAGTFGIDKSEPLVGDTITATLAPTTPSALNPTTQVVVYEWYSGDTADAITTRITDAGGNTYQVAVTGKFFKVDVRVIGYHGTKAAATTSASEAPLITEKDSAPFAVTAGDTALKITGTTTTASFKDGAGIKVYVKDTGKEALITDAASAPTGYAAPSGTPVLIAEHDATSGKPVLWVKGLDAAATPAPSGKLLSGTSDITVKIAVGAQDGDVGAVAAASGKPVVIVAQEYTVGNGEDNNTIKFTAGTPNKVKYDHGGTDVGDTNLDDTFDAALIAVLTVLEATDTIQFGAGGGAITDIGVLAASPTAAKVTAALGFAPAVTLGNDLSLTADFAVPAGKTLTVAAGKTITVAAEKVLDVTNGSIVLKANAATAIVLSPKNAAAADGGGAKLTFTGGSAHAVAKSGATSAQLTATADAAANLKFAGAGGTHITNLDNSTPAVINGSLVAGTSTGGNATDGTITLKGYASADVTISATTTFETTT
ncbi:MAG: hypothetical protein LBD24_03095, partial [Spirochaetaceae bacterium]|nr:hypothetical protein [Spirochaetaceae bacterium]